jgi:hypothetical protein
MFLRSPDLGEGLALEPLGDRQWNAFSIPFAATHGSPPFSGRRSTLAPSDRFLTPSCIKIRLLTELKYKNQALNVMEFCKNLTCKTESRRD